ncbi:MAG: uracil-DNA glycosylase [Candidatus Eremiobacteraeota bacterium]|nr:uracil-DNA glycosylase [Candidatus Eremiobacteraeota bacterium]
MPDKLSDIENEIRVCKKCPLYRSRINAVPGEGSATSGIVFVGEGPGKLEDEQGRPFVGPAGKFLDKLLDSIGISRDSVYITNLVKCRPPGNRDPRPEEIEACVPYLRRQVVKLKPKIMVALGNFALKRLVAPTLSISRVHGKIFERGIMQFFASYHPAAALYNKRLEPVMFRDFEKLGELLEKLK